MEALHRTSGRLIRVVVTGSESTGKSTLARALADHFDAELVPEFVREFAELKGGVISFADHGPIARGQMELEDSHASVAIRGHGLLIQDTDLLSTVVYCDHYFGGSPQWISDAARARRPDLYLLLGIDVPWIPDGIRDREHLRAEMHEPFLAAVVTSGAPYAVIEGSWEERMRLATSRVAELLESRSQKP